MTLARKRHTEPRRSRQLEPTALPAGMLSRRLMPHSKSLLRARSTPTRPTCPTPRKPVQQRRDARRLGRHVEVGDLDDPGFYVADDGGGIPPESPTQRWRGCPDH
ncbi:hypothetical protein C8039_17510 [Halogeometricum sp. wsp3]|nr:hypothetical protein C8039_17510 [Halogeometricum sp. wsp3]